MRKLLFALAAGTALLTAAAAPASAQYFWGGSRYCWYDDGWHGPGWYYCGIHWRHGFGWGGGFGWHGWGGHGYRSGYRGFHGGGHRGFHEGGGHGGGHHH